MPQPPPPHPAPVLVLLALQNGHWSTVVYRSPNLVRGQPFLWAKDTCVQLDLRVGAWMITCRRCASQHLSCEGKGQQTTSAHPYVQTSCLTHNWKRLMGSFFLKRCPWFTIDGAVVAIRDEAVAKATWRCKFTPSSRERPCFRFGGALIMGDAAGCSGFKHRQQHHTSCSWDVCFCFVFFLFYFFVLFYCLCGNSPR